METNTIVLLVLMVIVLGCLVGIAVMTLQKSKRSADYQLNDLVKQINDAHTKMFQFDKTLESNLKRMEENMEKIGELSFGMKGDVDRMKRTMPAAGELSKQVKTANVDTADLTLAGRFMLSATVPNSTSDKVVQGSAKGEDWLVLTKPGTGEKAGFIVGKLRTIDNAIVDGSVAAQKDVYAQQDVRVGRDVVLEGSNRWILHTPDDGRKSMYIAPFTQGKWDWSKQVAIDELGNMAVSGGIQAKGGKSTYNTRLESSQFPDKDGVNRIRGDTTVQGNVGVDGAVRFNRMDPGAMVEKRYSDDDADRYGMGQFDHGQYRIYSGSRLKDASLNLSLAKERNTFDDIVKIKTDRTVEIKGPAKFEQNLETSEVSMKKMNVRNTAKIRMGSNPRDVVEVLGNDGGGEKVLASFRDGGICFGNMCLSEANKKLQVCTRDNSKCKEIGSLA